MKKKHKEVIFMKQRVDHLGILHASYAAIFLL